MVKGWRKRTPKLNGVNGTTMSPLKKEIKLENGIQKDEHVKIISTPESKVSVKNSVKSPGCITSYFSPQTHGPPTPHRINMRSTQNDDSDTRNSTDDIEKNSFEVREISVKSNEKKIPSRGRGKLKYNISTESNIANQNHKVTEYFAVRRSVRKCKKTVLEEKQRDLENKVLCEVEDGLEVKVFVGKGRGVVTTREFKKGEFVVEYAGDLIDQVEAKARESEYAKDQNTGCYMYYFQHRNQQYCVDATAETDKLGRLVNHSRSGNLIARVVEVGNTPHLVLTAKDDIPIGVELTYDYGDRSRESIRNHPWLAL